MEGLAFFLKFVDGGMGDNSKQSVDSDVATISGLGKKKKLASVIIL
jgi:hypothetical protein